MCRLHDFRFRRGASSSDTPDNVDVRYKDPRQFTEATPSAGPHLIDTKAYLKPLKDYIAQRASRILVPGQRLDIEVTDAACAGEYEPWRGPNFQEVRVIKNLYPPRIDLDFTLCGVDGKVLSEGSRKLRNPAFLDTTPSPIRIRCATRNP